MPLPFRPLQPNDTADARALDGYLRDLEQTVINLHNQLAATVSELKEQRAKTSRLTMGDMDLIRRELQSGGAHELDLTNLTGLGSESPSVRFPLVTAVPDPYSAPYDAYILNSGSNYTLYQIDRSQNPPVAIAITATATPHDILSTVHSDSLAGAVVRGDLIVGNATPKWARLAKGTADQVFRMDGTGTDPGYGSVADAALSANVALLNRDPQTFTGNNVFNSLLKINGELQLSGLESVDNTLSPYDVPANTNIIAVDTSGGAVTIRLPATVSIFAVYIIFDVTGDAAVNNVTIDGNTNLINGAATITLNVGFSGKWIYGTGSDYNIIGTIVP